MLVFGGLLRSVFCGLLPSFLTPVAQVVALEARAAAQVEAAVHETAQQRDATLAAVRAQLENTQARRVKLEQDLAVRVDMVRREADTAHAAHVQALEAQAAEQVEAAVREAAEMLVEAMKQHDVALARVRTEAQADVACAEDRLVDLNQEIADPAQAQIEAVRAAAETAQQRDAALAAARAQLEDAEARRVKLEQDLAVRVDTVRREADTAHAAQLAALEAQAAVQVEAARREGAQMLVETMMQHDVALARVRTEAQPAVAHAEDRLVDLSQEIADRAEAQAAVQIEVVRAAAETAQRCDAAVRAPARADVARAGEPLGEVEQTLTAIRKEADLAQAKVERLAPGARPNASRPDVRRVVNTNASSRI